MPLPVIANTVRCSVEGRTEQGTNWANVLHFLHSGGAPTAGDIANLITEVDKLYTGPSYGGGATFWSGVAVNGAVLDNIKVTPLDGSSATVVSNVNQAGADTADPLPAGAALVLTHRTSLRGRSRRGRTYIAGLGEGFNVASGNPDSASISNFLSQWSQFRTALAGINWSFVVASYLHADTAAVASTGAQARWRSQRRRNPA